MNDDAELKETIKYARKNQVIGGDCWISSDLVCVLLNVKAQTLAYWKTQPDPPPYDPVKRLYSAAALGEWIRKKQTLRKGQGGRYNYLPDGVVVIGDQPTTSGSLPSATSITKPTPTGDLNHERLRKERAQADKIEMENDVQRGELVRAADVTEGWTNILSRVKTRMMQVPYTIAVMVTGDTDQSVVQAKANDIVRDALSEMSANWRDAEGEE